MEGRRARRTASTEPRPALASPLKDTREATTGESAGGTTVAQRRSQRKGRSTSIESSGTADAATSRRNEKKSNARPRPELAPLSEETHENPQSHEFSELPGRASNISGTTARTSGSVHELAEMSSEDMRNYLPELYDYSTGIIGLCTPPEASTAAFKDTVQKLKSDRRTRKTLEKYTKAFDEVLSYFATETYINPSLALCGLLDIKRLEDIGNGPWRPDDVLFKANLAATVEELMSSNLGTSRHGISLEKLDRDFPERFLAAFNSHSEAFPAGSSALLTESFEVGLELRTQFAVKALALLSSKPTFNAGQIIGQCFYDTEDGSLRGWNIGGLQRADLSSAQTDAIRSRIGEIEMLCSEDQTVINLDILQAQYPAAKFVKSFVTWARIRSNEIDRRLESLTHNFGQKVGEGIQKALDNEILRRKALSDGRSPSELGYVEITYQPSSDVPSSFISASKKDRTPKSTAPAKFGSAQHVGRLLARTAEAAYTPTNQSLQRPQPKASVNQISFGSTSEKGLKPPTVTGAPKRQFALREAYQAERSSSRSASTPSAQHISGEPTSLPDNLNEGDLDLGLTPMDNEETAATRGGPARIPSSEVRREVISLHGRIEADQNKENVPTAALERSHQKKSLLDAQAGAQRIEFESQSHSPATAPLNPEGSDEQTSDISEDEGFEQDKRIPQQKPIMRSSKRQRQSTELTSPEKRVRIVSQPEKRVQTAPQRSSQAREEGIPSGSQMYRKVNQQAKTLTIRKNNSGSVQRRVPWSEQETEVLIDFIENLGISWAKIKEEDEKDNGDGGILASRDQVALKDKARNMKFDYLKARAKLPVNFELIPLKQAQVDKLAELGVVVPNLQNNKR